MLKLHAVPVLALLLCGSAANAQAPAAPTPASAPKCDAGCVKANMDKAAQACARPIETRAPTDYEWLTRPFASLFQEADQSSAENAVVVYRGDSIRFLTAQKEWVRVSYECAFDVATQRIVDVRVRPGRLDQPQVQQATTTPPPRGVAGPARQQQGKPPAGVPKIKADLLATAIADAVKRRRSTPPHSPKTVTFGEPSPIDIQQVQPLHTP